MKVKNKLRVLIFCMFSIFMMSSVAFAKTTTYPALSTAYSNANGTAYMSGEALKYRDAKGKVTTLVAKTAKFDNATKLYIRGSYVYYSTRVGGTYAVNVDTKAKTTISSKGALVGGYGSAVIYMTNSNIYKYQNGKSTKLFKSATGNASIFNGFIYDGNQAYNIAAGTLSSYKMYVNKNGFYGPLLCNQNYNNNATKSNFYYINANHNLTRKDSSNQKTSLCKSVDSILGAYGSKCIFKKQNKIYLSTGNTVKEMCDFSTIQTLIENNQELYKECSMWANTAIPVKDGVVVDVSISDGSDYGKSTFVWIKNDGSMKIVMNKMAEGGAGFMAYSEQTLYYGLSQNAEMESYKFFGIKLA